MLMNLIGFDIENLSYNWSIITYRNSNTNSVRVFHCIKLITSINFAYFRLFSLIFAYFRIFLNCYEICSIEIQDRITLCLLPSYAAYETVSQIVRMYSAEIHLRHKKFAVLFFLTVRG